jgi:hypothetical protein
VGVLKVLVDGVWRKVGCGTGSAAGIADDFNRTDGPTLVADRSDGGLWTVAGSDWELADGRLIRTTSGVGSPLSDRWVYADYGFDQTVTVVTKFNFMFLDGGMGWYVAVDAAGTAGFAVVYDANFPRMELIDIASNTAIASPVAAPSPDGTERTMTITYDYTSGAITVDIDGTNYFTETAPSLYTDTGLGLYSYRPYATYQCYYDDVDVTGTGGAVPGRLRLWTGTEWVRELCDDDVPPSPTSTVTDDFAGAAAALNGRTTTTGGLTWTADSGLRLDGSGRITNNGLGTYTAEAHLTPVGSAGEDQDVLLADVVTGTGAGLFLADSGGTNRYQVNLGGDGSLRLYRNNIQQLVGSAPAITNVDLAARLRINDLGEGVVTVSVAGVDRLIYTDTAPLTGRGAGFFIQPTADAASFTSTATTPVTMTTVSDAFNRSNGAPGSPWVQGGNGTATADIISNAVGDSGPYGGSGSGEQPTVKRSIGAGDLDISAKVPVLPNADDMGITFRAASTYTPAWYAAVDSGGHTYLYSPLVGAPSSGGNIAAGGVLRVTVIDDTVTLFADGVHLDHRTETSGRDEVRAGLYFEFNNSSGRLDDFKATVVPRYPVPHPLKIEDPDNPGTWITVACMVPV